MTERIDYAAIECNGKIYTGARHLDIKAEIYGEYKSISRLVEGFFTSERRFVRRREAARIAFAAGQTSAEKDFLYSEDVW